VIPILSKSYSNKSGKISSPIFASLKHVARKYVGNMKAYKEICVKYEGIPPDTYEDSGT